MLLYVTFDVDQVRPGMDDWFDGLATTTRGLDGCVLYEYLADPIRSSRRAIVEGWETAADRDAYLVMPHHVQMVAEATSRWGAQNFHTLTWLDAGTPAISGRQRSEQPTAGRDQLNQLVAAFSEATANDQR